MVSSLKSYLPLIALIGIEVQLFGLRETKYEHSFIIRTLKVFSHDWLQLVFKHLVGNYFELMNVVLCKGLPPQ